MSPAFALEVLQGGAGTRYDPNLVQLLVNLLGRYPPGTLLQLEDGRLVRVVGRCRSPDTFARPLCEVLRLAHGAAASPGLQVDLAMEVAVRSVVEAS